MTTRLRSTQGRMTVAVGTSLLTASLSAGCGLFVTSNPVPDGNDWSPEDDGVETAETQGTETDGTEESSADTGETGETGETSETGETGETGELGAQDLCEMSAGTWDPNSCGHYECGVPSPDACIDPGCDCGAMANFVEGEGCVLDPECANGAMCAGVRGCST